MSYYNDREIAQIPENYSFIYAIETLACLKFLRACYCFKIRNTFFFAKIHFYQAKFPYKYMFLQYKETRDLC